MYDQPELESILRSNLKRHPSVTLRGSVEVTDVVQLGAGPAQVMLTDRSNGEEEIIEAQYVLACDGANSLVRRAIGAAMEDLHFEQNWLVVDIATDADLEHWEGVHQVCDPVKAATYMRIGTSRYRWEFRLGEGESADDYRDLDQLHPLLAPWTADVPVERLELVRCAGYTFRAQVADRWRDRRVFLLGDAAHLTPPFIGQGLCAGVRDSANLSWKLAGVITGSLPESVLDTYQIERRPHARALIRLATIVGAAMTAGGEFGNLMRRFIAPRLQFVPGIKDHILDAETPPLARSALVHRGPLGRSLAGRLCPNAELGDGRRFDDVAGGRFALVTTIEPDAAGRAAVEARGGAVVTARRGTTLHDWLLRAHARAAIVCPDGTVMRATRNPSSLCRAMPTFASAPHISSCINEGVRS